MLPVVLIMTWFVNSTPTETIAIEFESMESCSDARYQIMQTAPLRIAALPAPEQKPINVSGATITPLPLPTPDVQVSLTCLER